MDPSTHPVAGMSSTVSGVSESPSNVECQIYDQILFQLQRQNAMTAQPQVSKQYFQNFVYF